MKSLTTLLALGALAAAGCGDQGRPPVFETTGKVFYEGRPARHATVILHPAGDADPAAPRPRAKVGPDGTFRLTTYDAGDGAPAGEYAVTVEWWLADGRDADAPRNRLPRRYASGATSGLRARVTAGRNELEPFRLRP